MKKYFPTFASFGKMDTMYYVVWLCLIYGLLYKGLLSHEIALWGIGLTWGFFFFDSRWFAGIALLYFVCMVSAYQWGGHTSAERFGGYLFWYVLLFVVASMVEERIADQKQ